MRNTLFTILLISGVVFITHPHVFIPVFGDGLLVPFLAIVLVLWGISHSEHRHLIWYKERGLRKQMKQEEDREKKFKASLLP